MQQLLPKYLEWGDGVWILKARNHMDLGISYCPWCGALIGNKPKKETGNERQRP